jgi:hypothetical protein
MLRLVSHNTNSQCTRTFPQNEKTATSSFTSNSSPSLLFDFQEISPGIWKARFLDTLYELRSEITLVISDSLIASKTPNTEDYFQRILVADYPAIQEHKLAEKVNWDKYLQEIIKIQFQLEVLEQLLLFCEKFDAGFLIFNFDNANLDYLEIYRPFIVSEEETITSLGERTEITIPTDIETYDALIEFIYEINQDFCHTLWRYQKTNPAFRNYLKSHSLLVH